MRPAFLDQMSWEMAEVYGAVTDEILINLAHYFPYYNAKTFPRSSITYQADMLAQLGQVNKETMRIIRRNLQGASPALKKMLEQVIIDSVQAINPPLVQAVQKNIFAPPSVPIVEPNQMRAFQLYYQQAADKLNLVNTVMLESTQQAYQNTVADIAARVQATQTALDIGAGETITGVSTWNKATQHAITRLQRDGITGFIDHAGHRWSAEAYVAMDIRTTVYNTGRAAVWETNQSFGNDLYQVSYHNGARPLCYPWQNKVISSIDAARTVVDLDGNEVQVYAQSETTYGQAAGLFGVNCKHYPNPFIPGVSVIRGEPQDQKANDRTYEESQYQRSLERKIREDKRDLLMLKAQGAPEELIEAQTEKVRADSATITEFCDKTGRARHRDREGVYTKRTFPAAETYDVTQFVDNQRRMINSFYQKGGAQQGYTFGQMVPNVPLVPKTAPAPKAQRPAINYGKPFDDNGYTKPTLKKLQGAKDTLDAAPDNVRNAWSKCAPELRLPSFRGPGVKGAYYHPVYKRTYYESIKEAFDESTYQRKNVVWFHEYGHNIDNILGGGGKKGFLSETYKNGLFGQTIQKECEAAVTKFYLHKNGFSDAYDAVKAAQNGAGGMGFGAYIRQALRSVMPGADYRAIRGTLLDAGDDDSILRPLAEKHLKSLMESELRSLVHKKEVGQAFCEWVKTTYSIYERGDISDMFERYTIDHYGMTYPFGIGHGKIRGGGYYAHQPGATEKEAFAEMYSALATQNDSLPVIMDFFPESFALFEEMLGSVV